MEKKATANDVKKYFEYATVADFKKDWDRLNDEEKEFFRVEVGRVIFS